MSEDKPDLTIQETADGMRVSDRHVWKLIAIGKLASYKVGRCRRVRRDSYEALRAGEEVA